MTHISQSASLLSIKKYLKMTHGLTDMEATQQADEVYSNLTEMRNKGFIEGWYFDDHGHLELEPTSSVLNQIQSVIK
ncbi:hypothetical protein [Paraferrimonas haliotis]|uniref:Uncharacterized protein n=1 Tax=Paraferrimonas haliotis TaxID=2013866 RepID=A0AA37TRC3_9GAMM|nr:hypothetical protein [Paraferrimonas haliotis]GLS84218.1 hypothetical protein GCM10007894_21950 [Paraferrimonas haliotis]